MHIHLAVSSCHFMDGSFHSSVACKCSRTYHNYQLAVREVIRPHLNDNHNTHSGKLFCLAVVWIQLP